MAVNLYIKIDGRKTVLNRGKLKKRFSLFTHLSIALALVFVSNTIALANPPSLYVTLFQARPRIDKLFVRAPFVISNPIHAVFRDGLYEITDEGGGVLVTQIGGRKRKLILRAPHVVISDRARAAIEIGPDLEHMRKYYGQLTVKRRSPGPRAKKGGGLTVVNLIDSFNYVASVVGGETTPEFGKEALKAQAVLVYTRLSPKGRHPAINDTTDEMVYLGAQHERTDVIDAVSEVDRRRLMFRDRPAQAFFHACCAGRTSRGKDVFGENAKTLTYLQSVPCNFCKESPLYGTTIKQIPEAVFNRDIADDVPIVLKADEAKRIVSAEIKKAGKREVLSGYQLWLRIGQRLGWDKAPGTRYQIKKNAGNYTIKSSGGGHGVGLCQWGAHGLAKQKKTYTEILQYYFPGTTVERR